MDVRERKMVPSLPPDYVSLAQLQERWLKKKEEEEKREAERKLKQKQEEEERRERDARAAHNEKNQYQRGRRNDGRTKTVGGLVREKGVIQGKGKGKEIVTGGTGIGRENDNTRNKKQNFKRAAAVKSIEKIGVDAKELRVGDTMRAGFSSSGVAGVGGGLIGVEEKRTVSVEVFPRNGVTEESSNVKRADLRGGFKGNYRNRGSGKVNEFKKSEIALNLEKKMEVKKVYVMKWIERPINRLRDAVLDTNNVDHALDALDESNNVGHTLEKKAGDKVSQVRSELSSLSVKVYSEFGEKAGDRNGIRGNISTGSFKTEEDRVEGEGSNGEKGTMEMEKKVDHRVLAGESARKGETKKGYQIHRNQSRGFNWERRGTRTELSGRLQEMKPRNAGSVWVKKEKFGA